MDNKRKKVLNTVTYADLENPEVLAQLVTEMNPVEGEIIIQQEEDGIRIWSKGKDGILVSTPSKEELEAIIDEKLEGFTPPSNGNNNSGNGNGTVVVDLTDYAKKVNLKTINGESIYDENGGGNLEIKPGVDSETLKEYATKKELESIEKDVNDRLLESDFLSYKYDTLQSLNEKVEKDKYSQEIQSIKTSLNLKANSDTTASKSYVANMISNISSIRLKLVTRLPDNSIDAGIVYLMKVDDTYKQFLYSNEDAGYIEIGKFETDLSGYYDSVQTDSAIENSINAAVFELENNFETELNKKANTNEVVSTVIFKDTFDGLSDRMDKMEKFTAEGYYTEEEIDDNFYKKTEVYTKGEVDDFIEDVSKKLNSDEFNNFKEEVNESISKKLDSEEFKTYSGITESILESKVDKETLENDYYTKKDIDAHLAATSGESNKYGMVVIPEETYDQLRLYGKATYNGVELEYSDAVIYYLFDPNEEVTLPEFNPNFNNSRVELREDYNPSETIVIGNEQTCTLVLNDYGITAPVFTDETDNSSNSYGVWVTTGGNLTIEGNGFIQSQNADYSMAVWAQGGTVVIKGGLYKNAGEGCDLIYASAGGQVEIYGGEFFATPKGTQPGTSNEYSALNIKNSDREISKIVVYGGKFYGFDPSDAEGSEPMNSPGAEEWHKAHPNGFVAEDYESVKLDYVDEVSGREIWEVRKKEA